MGGWFHRYCGLVALHGIGWLCGAAVWICNEGLVVRAHMLGGGGCGSFSDLAAAYSLKPPSSVV